jgi:hypothetical protein
MPSKNKKISTDPEKLAEQLAPLFEITYSLCKCACGTLWLSCNTNKGFPENIVCPACNAPHSRYDDNLKKVVVTERIKIFKEVSKTDVETALGSLTRSYGSFIRN